MSLKRSSSFYHEVPLSIIPLLLRNLSFSLLLTHHNFRTLHELFNSKHRVFYCNLALSKRCTSILAIIFRLTESSHCRQQLHLSTGAKMCSLHPPDTAVKVHIPDGAIICHRWTCFGYCPRRASCPYLHDWDIQSAHLEGEFFQATIMVAQAFSTIHI